MTWSVRRCHFPRYSTSYFVFISKNNSSSPPCNIVFLLIIWGFYTMHPFTLDSQSSQVHSHLSPKKRREKKKKGKKHTKSNLLPIGNTLYSNLLTVCILIQEGIPWAYLLFLFSSNKIPRDHLKAQWCYSNALFTNDLHFCSIFILPIYSPINFYLALIIICIC